MQDNLLSQTQLHAFVSARTINALPMFLHRVQRLYSFGRITNNDHIVFCTEEKLLLRINSRISEILYVNSGTHPGYYYGNTRELFWGLKATDIPSHAIKHIAADDIRNRFSFIPHPPQRISIIFDTPSPPLARVRKENWINGTILKKNYHYRIEHLPSIVPEKNIGNEKLEQFNGAEYEKFFPYPDLSYSAIKPHKYLSLDIYTVIQQFEQQTKE